MGRVAAALVQATRPRYIVVGRFVWGVRRVNSDDLRQVGHANLEGSAAGRQAAADVTAARRQAQDLARGAAPDQVEQHEAELQRKLQEIMEKRNASITSSPEGDKALTQRLDGYILAAVERSGMLRQDAQFPPVHVLDDDLDPATILRDLRSPAEIEANKAPMYTEPHTFVREESQEDESKGHVWLHRLSAEDRRTLGMAIAQLQGQSALAEVTPFRNATDAGAPVAADAVVPRDVAPRVPGPDAVPDGPGRRGDAARADGRGKAPGGHEDGRPRRDRR